MPLAPKFPVIVDPDTDNIRGSVDWVPSGEVIDAVIVEPETLPDTVTVTIPRSTHAQTPLFWSLWSFQTWGQVSEPANVEPACAIARVDRPLAVIGAGVPFAQLVGEPEPQAEIMFMVPDQMPVRSG